MNRFPWESWGEEEKVGTGGGGVLRSDTTAIEPLCCCLDGHCCGKLGPSSTELSPDSRKRRAAATPDNRHRSGHTRAA